MAESEPHPDAACGWPGGRIGGRGYAAGMVVQKVWEVESKGDDAPSVVWRGCAGVSGEFVLLFLLGLGLMGWKDDPVSGGYAVELEDTRDPRQTPLALPINTCDESRVDVRVADWDDGMRTLKYRPMRLANPGVEAGREEGEAILKHVFTCNSEELQWEATPLFAQIQREVCLSKRIGDPGE